MRIIPAIDIIEGKCVRLTQGDYAQQKTYNENPLEVAKMFEDHGISYLHLVDLDGAKAGEIKNIKILEKITNNTKLIVDFGGGIKTSEAAKMAFEAGASQITAGSIAVKSPETVMSWIEKFGAEKIIIGADVRDKFIAIHGWQEQSSLELQDFLIPYLENGLNTVICTDIAKDGMLQGPSFDLYTQMTIQNPKIQLIASGGVHVLEDMIKLAEMNLYGAILGKAIYEDTISMKELAKFNSDINAL